MHTPSINTLLAMGLLFSAPLTSALALRFINQDSIASTDIELITARGIAAHDIAARNIATLITRHRTEAQNGARKGAAGGNSSANATTVNIDSKAGNSTAKAGKKGKAVKNGRAQLFGKRGPLHRSISLGRNETAATNDNVTLPSKNATAIIVRPKLHLRRLIRLAATPEENSTK